MVLHHDIVGVGVGVRGGGGTVAGGGFIGFLLFPPKSYSFRFIIDTLSSNCGTTVPDDFSFLLSAHCLKAVLRPCEVA